MSGGEILTAVLTVVGGIVASIIAAFNIRPKVKAEASAATTGGDVAVSTDAREWVREFRADAQEARQRATSAEKRAEEAEDRIDALERRFDALIKSLMEHRSALSVFTPDLPPLPPEIER